jgi:hypothetical protein
MVEVLAEQAGLEPRRCRESRLLRRAGTGLRPSLREAGPPALREDSKPVTQRMGLSIAAAQVVSENKEARSRVWVYNGLETVVNK